MEEFSVLAETWKKAEMNWNELVPGPTQTLLILASFSAAGIFFCFLVKEKAPDLMGETDVEAQRLPERNKDSERESTYLSDFLATNYTCLIQNSS